MQSDTESTMIWPLGVFWEEMMLMMFNEAHSPFASSALGHTGANSSAYKRLAESRSLIYAHMMTEIKAKRQFINQRRNTEQ